MNLSEFDELLQKTCADRHLSRNEKRIVKEIIEEQNLSARQLADFRRRAFAVANNNLNHPPAKEILAWLEEVIKLLQPPPAPPKKKHIAQAFFSPRNDCPRKIASLISSAKRTIDVCVFTITDDRISLPLLKAHQSGIALRIITDNDKRHDAGSDIKQLCDAGIPVRVDKSQHHMHHKFALFDQAQLLTGSYNWTRGAAESNMENFIVTNDPVLRKEFSILFEDLWRELPLLNRKK